MTHPLSLRPICWAATLLFAAVGVSLLAQDAPGSPPPDTPRERTDRHGDPLPEGAINRLGTLRFRSESMCDSVSYSSDGEFIVTDGPNNSIIIWDSATGSRIRTISGGKTGIRRVALSKDGKRIVSQGWQKVGIWDVESGAKVQGFSVEEGWITAVALSADGRYVAAGTDHTQEVANAVLLWETETGDRVKVFEGHQGEVMSAAFSMDGKVLATGGDGGAVILWDVENRRMRRRLDQLGDSIVSVAISPCGQTLAAAVSGGGKRRIYLWDLETGKETVKVDSGGLSCNSVTFSPDGKLLASAGRDHVIRLWSTATGEQVRVLEGSRTEIHSCSFSPDGARLASVGSGKKVRIWDVGSGVEIHRDDGHIAEPRQIVFSPDGRTLVSTSVDASVRVWDVSKGENRLNLTGHENPYAPLAFSRDGKVLAIGVWEGGALLVDPSTGEELRRSPATGRAVSLDISPDGSRLVMATRDRIQIRDLETGEQTPLSEAKYSDVEWVAFSQDGEAILAMGIDKDRKRICQAWNADSMEEIWKFSRWEKGILTLGLHDSGTTTGIVGSKRGTQLIRLPGGRELLRVDKAKNAILSRDGRLMAARYASRLIRVWEVDSGSPIHDFPLPDEGISCLAFSRDGRSLAVGNVDSTILIWSLAPENWQRPEQGQDSSAEEMDRLWARLLRVGPSETLEAHAAIWTLAGGGESAAAYLTSRVVDSPGRHAELIDRLLLELDHGDFHVREKAHQGLLGLGAIAEGAVGQAVADTDSPEVRWRGQVILDRLATEDVPYETSPSEPLRRRRALHILERIGTEAARDALEAVAERSSWKGERAQAKGALNRLAERK